VRRADSLGGLAGDASNADRGNPLPLSLAPLDEEDAVEVRRHGAKAEGYGVLDPVKCLLDYATPMSDFL
jgi:hypothetical protein